MRKLGQDAARQSVYPTMTARISTAGIIAGVLLVLFGIFTVTMLYYLAIELAKKGFNVTGVEISSDFVKIEKKNAKEANVLVDFKEGNASKLPCEDNYYDFIVCSAAFKNFKEPGKGIT